VLKANIRKTPTEIVDITQAWFNLIDFQQTALINATKTTKTIKYNKIKRKSPIANKNKYTQYYTINIYKTVITAIYMAYEEKINSSSEPDEQYISNIDIELILQKFYTNNNEHTLRNKRTAYTIVLQKDGYIKTKEGKHANNFYVFMKRPEWIPEIDIEEIRNRRLIELQTMRKN
jgi:hypothetical protein